MIIRNIYLEANKDIKNDFWSIMWYLRLKYGCWNFSFVITRINKTLKYIKIEKLFYIYL